MTAASSAGSPAPARKPIGIEPRQRQETRSQIGIAGDMAERLQPDHHGRRRVNHFARALRLCFLV